MSFIGGQSNPELVTLTAKVNGTTKTGFPTINVSATFDSSTQVISADSNTDVLLISGTGVLAAPNTTTDILTLTTTADLRLSQAAVKEAVTTWRHQPVGTGFAPMYALSSVLWVSELGLFVATANYAGVNFHNIVTSPDGIHWTARFTNNTSVGWDSICWSPERGLLLAVQSDSFASTQRVVTSPDGITWTLNGNSENNRWVAVIWVKELGLFVAVSKAGGTFPDRLVQTDATGATPGNWNPRTTTVSDLRCVAWSKELGRLVALGHATSNEMQSSTNGIAWTAHALPGAGTIMRRAVAWSPELGLFVAVGEDVITSGNGTTWTLGTLPGGVTDCYSVIWVPEFRAFVAVTNDPTNRFMISFDGFAWTTSTFGDSYQWRFLGWSPDLGILVAVGSGLEALTTGPGVLTSKRLGIWGSIENEVTHAQAMSRLSMRI